MKNINFKSVIILTMIAIAFFSCQKDEDIATPTSLNRFKVPSISEAKSHFETNNKIPILDDNNNGIEFRTGAATMTIKWDEASTKKYKDETDTSPQQVDILYTPITLSTQGNAKMFLASIDDNGTVDSKYVFIIYTIPENPRLFSGYVFIYDLDGNQENMLKYEEGIIVSTASNSRMAQRNDGDGGGGFTMGELLDFIGGDWFGLDGYIENDLVEVYWPEFADVDDFGGGPIDDSPWFNPINIPVGNNSGGSGGNGNTGNGYDPNDIVWWQPLTIFAHGLSISNAIEVDLDSIEANWLMNTATQEQLNSIADHINNLDQTESDGYNQGDIDVVIDILYYMMLNGNFNFDDITEVRNGLDKECQKDLITNFTTMSTDSPIHNFVQNTFFGNNEFNLQFEDVNLDSMQAQTLYPNGLVFSSNNYASIQFDNNFLENATDLAIVMTAAHEFIHLYLAYLYSQGLLTAAYPQYGDLEDALDAFKENPNIANGETLSNEMHSVYDDHLDSITNAVFAYATANNISGATESYCRKLVTGAHPQTDAYQNLNDTEKQDHDNVASDEINGHQNSKGSKCNN
ncbi:MAG: hypothetical protein ACI8QQ_002428 [Psychroserpens sp.]|jgi:hypothetical protein